MKKTQINYIKYLNKIIKNIKLNNCSQFGIHYPGLKWHIINLTFIKLILYQNIF